MSRTRQNRFRNTGGNRVEDQFGFLMNKNYSNTGGRSGQEKTSKENIDANRAKAMQNLKSFIGNTFGSAIDTVTLGATDFDKKGDSPFQANLKNTISSTADSFKRQETADPNQTQLGSPFDRQQYNRDFRNMLITDTALRDFEMRREKQRNLDMFKKTMPLVDIAAEPAAQRRLMEDRSSPTKISQQILRARQGEAALMQATADQLRSAAAASAQGIGPRGRAGGA